MTRVACAFVLGLLACASCGGPLPRAPRAPGAQITRKFARLEFMDLDRRAHLPLEFSAGQRASVLFFVTTDCPIANAYAPEIGTIVRAHRERPLRFFLAHVDPDTTAKQAREHAEKYALTDCPVILDSEHRLARALGITITPEVAVILADGSLAYRGRIDDLYADLGQRRRVARSQDLRAALAAVLEERELAHPRTEAVGCSLPILGE